MRKYKKSSFKNITDAAFNHAMTNETLQLETTKGSLFGAYNAVTGYFQNVRTYKDEEAKLKSVMFGGSGQMRTQRVFELYNGFMKNELIEFYN